MNAYQLAQLSVILSFKITYASSKQVCIKFKGAHTRRLYSAILATINKRHISAQNEEQKV